MAQKYFMRMHGICAAFLAACLLALSCTAVSAGAPSHPVNQYPYKLMPSADLIYAVKVKLYGIQLNGDAVMNWQSNGGQYSLKLETRSSFLGKVVEAQSEGLINSFGLAPAKMTEKRFNKSPYSTIFDRQSKTISFTAAKETYPLHGGEQDRNSVMFQLAAVVHGTSDAIKKGTEWTFFVAGRRDAQAWTFRLVGMEDVKTPMGVVSTLHLVRLQPAKARKQQIELWLAPSLEGYPVRILFKGKRQHIEQVLREIRKTKEAIATAGESNKS